MRMPTSVAARALTGLVVAALLCGCGSDGDKYVGAGVGAGAGALAGRSLAPRGNRTGGAIIGATVGGVSGYALAGGFGSKASAEERASPAFQQANTEFDAAMQAKRDGNSGAAIQHYQMASRLQPAQPESYNNAGMLYLEQGDRVNAESMFRAALQADPKCDAALTNLRMMGLEP